MGNIHDKIQEAKDTLFMAENYMDNLGIEFEQLRIPIISVILHFYLDNEFFIIPIDF